MSATNTAQHFGSVTKTFHWLTALLILTLLPLGWYANQLPYATDAELSHKAWMFSLHKTLGVAAFFVALLRIFWALGQTKPHLLHADRKLESFAAELVHWLLYGALVIVPLSGWITHAAAEGFAPIWWPLGQGLPLVPKSTGVEHVSAAVHWVSTKVLIAALLLHIAGALKHHGIDRDATLRRMLPGRPELPPASNQEQKSHTPAFAALTLWALALIAASLFSAGNQSSHSAEPAPELATVSSDWEVQQGTISLTVTQFGNTVSGSFEDWTAAITFDETIRAGKAGAVNATISIPSLALGSVTDQALGADFLNASDHPTATFDSDIVVVSDGYAAEGTLTIKEVSVPVRLPFALVIRDGQAEMRGDVTLDRRNFMVGENVKDEATLAYDVALRITLTARRATAD